MVNPGAVTTSDIVELTCAILNPEHNFAFWTGGAEFYQCVARAPRSNCILDASKLLSTGIRMLPVGEALESALVHLHLTEAPMMFLPPEIQPWSQTTERDTFERLFEPKN
jgi:hypothetical protein